MFTFTKPRFFFYLIFVKFDIDVVEKCIHKSFVLCSIFIDMKKFVSMNYMTLVVPVL